MRFSIGLQVAGLLAAAIFATGCSGGSRAVPAGVSSASAVLPRAKDRPFSPAGYKTLYSFQGLPDGSKPMAGLVAVHGLLYGLTSEGLQAVIHRE